MERHRTHPPGAPRRRALPAVVAALALVVVACGRWLPEASSSANGESTGDTAAANTAAGHSSSPTTSAATVAVTVATTTTTTTAAPTALELEEAVVALRLADVAAGTCTTVTYTPTTAGRSQVGDLCVPATRTTDTIVLLVHWGGGTVGSRRDLAGWQAWYTAHGVATFNIDYRLATSGSDDGVYPEPEQDLKAAVQFLRIGLGTIGADRIVVQGHSAGARLGGVILTTADDDAFAGDVRWRDVSDAVDGFIGFYGYYDGFQFDWQAYYGGDGSAPADVDALDRAGSATGPVLLVHGTDDELVVSSASVDFTSRLRDAGVDVDLVLLDGQEHAFDLADGGLTADGEHAAQRALSWLRELPTP